MDPEKIGKFIKELRKNNNLTQKQLADRYGVTYQAVSKWENGSNLPDISLLMQISKDFNLSIEELIDGELSTTKKTSNKKKICYIAAVLILVTAIISVIVINTQKDKSFKFKTLSTTCSEFKVSGSIAYNSDKSSIHISQIDYCGGDNDVVYKKIECNLYEKNKDTITKISSCKTEGKDTKLEEYLKDIELSISNYETTCKKYNDDSLYLEVTATDKNDKVVTYKIPLKFNECSK